MKRFLFSMMVLLAGTAAARTERATYRVTFASRDNGVVIADVPAWALDATVAVVAADAGTEIPCQLDDLDGDGVFDELAFVYEGLPADFRGEAAGQKPCEVLFAVTYRSEPAVHDWPARVNAQMWWKLPDKSLEEAVVLESDKDDMYHKLHHHGPAFESELAAYRVYFDKKQSIDTYGKKHPGLELRETMWYPSDEQLAAGSGHDNLRVFGSVSVGALKGWDAKKRKMVHILDMKRREARIRAAGPVRTVVDMRVEGWNYEGRVVDMTSRYILFAGHADVRAEHTVTAADGGGSVEHLLFTTGVMKIRDGFTATLRDSVFVSTGCDYPENDSVKWERERVALVAALPARQIVSCTDDALSHLAQLHPDARGRIDLRFWMFWQKSDWLDPAVWRTGAGMAAVGDWASCLTAPVAERLR